MDNSNNEESVKLPCGCKEMICNRCGKVIPVFPGEIGGLGEYETFWWESKKGKMHTHCCLTCQMELTGE